MNDPRKLPGEIASSDWDKLLDDLDHKVDEARTTEAPPPPEEKSAPSSAPLTPKTPSAPAFYRPPRAEDRPAAPRPAAGKPAVPKPAAPTPAPPPPTAAKTMPPPAIDDYEEERTVVGAIPRELMAESLRGGAGGLSQLLKRPEPAAAPSSPPIAESDNLDALLDEVQREETPAVDDDAVFTSAPDLSARARKRRDDGRPALPKPPVPRAAPPPPPPVRTASSSAPDPFSEPDARAESGSIPDAAGSLADPFAEPPRPPSPSTPEDASPVPGSAAPKLHEPDQRVYSSEDQTTIIDTTSIRRTERPVSIPDDVVGDVDAGDVAPELAIPKEPALPSLPDEVELEREKRRQRPRSVEPPPMPVAPSPTWTDERDAIATLADTQRVDEWLERAEWLASEAAKIEEKPARARALLVASELFAQAGDDAKASELAAEARDLVPSMPLAHRQARARAARERSFQELIPALEAESRVAPTQAARAHGAVLAAEIERLVNNDVEAASKRMELAFRAMPGDPRAHVQRITQDLAASSKPIAYRWPDAPGLAPLVEAVALLSAIRGASDKGAGARGPIDALTRARAALLTQNAAGAAEALAQLRSVREVGEGALWLSAALSAPKSETRPLAIEQLRELRGGAHPDLAIRALASRALEQGDAAAATSALASGAVFSDVERTALGALLGSPAETILPSTRAIAGDEQLAPLASAAEAVFTDGESPPVAGSDEARAAIAVGRALGRGVPIDDALARLSSTTPASPMVRALSLERDVRAGKWAEVAGAISGWTRESDANGDAARDRALAATLLFELIGDRERAADEADAARAADLSSEAAARISLALHPEITEKMFSDLAASVEDPTRRALLLVEAAMRAGPEASAHVPLLREAHEASTELPFPAALGAKWARRRGLVDELLGWVRLRREVSDDPSEAAYDQVREALLVAETDLPRATQLLEEASRARPEDLALRDLVDRFSTEPETDRAALRSSQADKAEGPAKGRLAFWAALEHEHAGDFESASRYAAMAVDNGAGELARRVRDRCDAFGAGASRLAEELMVLAREAQTPADEREAYERLAYLDEVGRGDVASGLLWHRSILERDATALPSLRRLEHALIGDGREDELEPIFTEIAKCTGGTEAVAHAQVASRLRQRGASWESSKDLVEVAVTSVPKPNLWALRQLFAHAGVAGDSDAMLRAARALAGRTDRPTEEATLLLRAAEAAARKDDLPLATELLRRVVELVPAHPVAFTALAEVLEKGGDLRGSAEALESAAAVSNVEKHQNQLRYDAAIAWLDKVGDKERGQKALETVADVDILYADVFPRLQALFTQAGERAKLASLLERRLEREEDPQKRVGLEVTRGRALAEVGDTEAAKQALAAALEGSPDNIEALRAFADICGKENDWEGAEQAIIRLARLITDPSEQGAIYMALGSIYRHRLPNPERAELAYREVLKRSPDSLDAKRELVAIYGELKDAERALEIQNELLATAVNPADKRQRTIELARIYEDVSGDVRKAETTLEALRKESPQDSSVLRALAEFHTRHNHGPAVNVLLDRAAADARRALTTGRFELHFFANLATVFELRGNADAARAAQGTVAALEARPSEVDGMGARAFRADLDDQLAPEIFTIPFRELLRQASSALEAATSIDLKGMRATPFPPSAAATAERIAGLGAAFGFPNAQLHVSPAIGPICIPASANPPTLVFGAALVAEPNEALREFLAIRAFKILQAHVSAFSRTAPIDLWPLTAAFLKALAPSWEPQGVDANKLSDFRNRLSRTMPTTLGPEVGALALEVIGSIGNRASTLQTAANAWGARCALLATGDTTAALDAIAFASGQPNGPPTGAADRLKWVGRNAEARDLVVYTVSNEYAEARAKASR